MGYFPLIFRLYSAYAHNHAAFCANVESRAACESPWSWWKYAACSCVLQCGGVSWRIQKVLCLKSDRIQGRTKWRDSLRGCMSRAIIINSSVCVSCCTTQKLGGFQLSKEAELAHSVYCNSKPRVLGHTIEARAEKALLDRRHVPPKDLMKEIQLEWSHTTYKAVERVRARLFEEGHTSYRKLRPYLEQLREANLGTFFDIAQDDDGTIQRVFFCMSACQNVLAYSKPVVMLDACHMTSSQKGTLFAACTQNGDNHIVPLAFCFGVSEAESTWN